MEPKSTRNVTVKLCYLMVHGLLEFRLSIKESLEWKHKEKKKKLKILGWYIYENGLTLSLGNTGVSGISHPPSF